jgi:hypothetical protein
METAPFDPDMGADIRRDALAELRNHADAEAASARTTEDVERSQEIGRMADDLERRLEDGSAAA